MKVKYLLLAVEDVSGDVLFVMLETSGKNLDSDLPVRL